mmetsp:Transcript_78980/g.154934  ORF Transcript_78980/g.154934 Transcript_78980/m.154934 type:complete len:239 (+) Transcript_78980:63-779(+)|eukprot:CAMPEP_0170201244 /NCGR_PEP_ID=MMETSP0116_2-20130129/71_1 /TAXON_ID=400756 /ORGANISM="Durinskia baltica, Strain CSIRO CS-38" /LENGTH=238 /DNA_ID=CAMNT_0010451445 /DNA_START=12 /DNA_END=728 /DNA_ORIENTATION=+
MRRLSWLRFFCSTLAVLPFVHEQFAFAFTSGIENRNLYLKRVHHGVIRDSGTSKVIPTRQGIGRSSDGSSKTKLSLWSRDEEITGSDKIKACVPYLLPLLDGEMFGKYIYERVPPLGFLDSLFVGPLYDFYSQVPLLGLILFLVLTLGTRGNTEMNRAVRFNAQQAALIDVLLVFPELIGSAFEGEDIPRYLVEPCMNFVWYTYMAMVLYSIYTNLQGKKPDQIPWISGYAELMVGPF